ncbi:DUF72 domain-containing protein [Chitinophaga lutea]
MEFGRVNVDQLQDIDFKLPAEPLFNKGVLPGHRRQPRIFLGTDKRGHKSWSGVVYPAGTREKDFLKEFVRQFNCLELNATHYHVRDEDLRRWESDAEGHDFLFCPKFPQSISHYYQLQNVRAQTDTFLLQIQAFGPNLGPAFLQIGGQFGPNRKDTLFNYLAALPRDLPYFLEVRHPEWFSDPRASQELMQTLRNLGAGAVITDTAGRRDCVHMHLPVSRAFIRFMGNDLHPTDHQRADDWVNRIQYWIEHGLEELYFFVHQHDESCIPPLAAYISEQLQQRCGVELPGPRYMRNTLF